MEQAIPNRNYIKGRQSEWACRRDLELLGFSCIRAAASQGVYDIAGVGADSAVVIQCKRGKAAPPPCEWKTLVEMPAPESVIRVVLYYPEGPAAVTGTAARVLWCSADPLPAWMAQVRWIDARSRKAFTQPKLRGI